MPSTLWALLSLLDDMPANTSGAAEQARRAFAVAEAHGLRFDPLMGAAQIACGRALRRAGHLGDAQAILTEAITILQYDSYAVAARRGRPRARVGPARRRADPELARTSVLLVDEIVRRVRGPRTTEPCT